jgi:hypothetical protein
MSRKQEQQFIEVSGNNGGSYVRIGRHDEDGLCWLSVGHQCVTRIQDKAVSVTHLAQILSDVFDP